jgi:hypothetical protein
MAYTWTPTVSGLVEVRVSGLSADLDLIVMQEVGDGCSQDSQASCIGFSARGGTIEEVLEFDAQAGETYYIIVDGFAGAVGNFTVEVRSTKQHVVLNERGGYAADADYLEILNTGACPVNYNGLVVEHYGTCDTARQTVTFTGMSNLPGGQTARVVESGAVAGRDITFNSCDLMYGDPSYTAICDGVCNRSTCGNLLDLLSASDVTTGHPDILTCASFTPAPVNVNPMTNGQSLNRVDFAPGYLQSNWAIGPASP